MCSKGIGLRAQNLLTILGSKVNMIGGPTWSFDEDENLHSDNELAYSNELQKLWGEWLKARFGFVNHLALIARFILYKKCMKSWKCPFLSYGKTIRTQHHTGVNPKPPSPNPSIPTLFFSLQFKTAMEERQQGSKQIQSVPSVAGPQLHHKILNIALTPTSTHFCCQKNHNTEKGGCSSDHTWSSGTEYLDSFLIPWDTMLTHCSKRVRFV